MNKRVCDKCGETKELEGGRTCETGHFICKHCVWETKGVFSGSDRKTCPICKKPLR